MHLVASVRPSVCPFVCALTAEPFDLQFFGPVSGNTKFFFWPYQFKVFVCNQWAYADNRAYAADRRFNFYYF